MELQLSRLSSIIYNMLSKQPKAPHEFLISKIEQKSPKSLSDKLNALYKKVSDVS